MSRMTFPLCLLFLHVTATTFAASDQDAVVKTAVQKFLQGREDRNLDDVMKVVDVPWYHDNKSVITDRQELQAEFHRLLSRKNRTKTTSEIKRILPFSQVRSQFTEDQLRMLDAVLAPTDCVVLIAVQEAGLDRSRIMPIFVRLRDGQAKVVGLLN